MKPETIKYILKLIEQDVYCKQDGMLNEIRWSERKYWTDAVDRYIEAYHAQDDFKDWCDEHECVVEAV